nr:MAG TPA: hypothetical protein [Caudoviricetes sp.]
MVPRSKLRYHSLSSYFFSVTVNGTILSGM